MKLCHFCRAHLGEFLDGTLAASDREKVAAHLESCPDCAREKRELELTLSTLRELKPVAAPPELRLKVRAALQDEAQSKRSGFGVSDFSWWRPGKIVWTGSLTLAAMTLILLTKPYSTDPILLPDPGIMPQSAQETFETQAPGPKAIKPQVPSAKNGKVESTVAKRAPRNDSNRLGRGTSTSRGSQDELDPQPDEVPAVVLPSKTSKRARVEAPAAVSTRDVGRSDFSAPPAPAPLPSSPKMASPKKAAPPQLPALPSSTTPPVGTPARSKTLAVPGNAKLSREVPVVTPPQILDSQASDTKPKFRFRGNSEDAATPQSLDSAGANRMMEAVTNAAEPAFVVSLTAMPEPRSVVRQPMPRGLSPVPPTVAPAPEVKASAGSGSGSAPTKMTENGEIRQDKEETTQSNRIMAQEARPSLTRPVSPSIAARAGAAPLAAVSAPERRYRLNVLVPREVKNAQITVVLPASVRFQANDASNSRVVWRGDFVQGQQVRISFPLTGIQGGEKISVQLEQIEGQTESKLLETQIITLPVSG